MREIHEIDQLRDFLACGTDLSDRVIQGLDLGEVSFDFSKVKLAGAVFLGCHYPSLAAQERLREAGALIFPRLPRLPYNPYRPRLYTRDELMDGWSEKEDLSLDRRIYDHFVDHGRHRPNVLEALAQRLHDHAIDDALHDLLAGEVEPGGEKKVVAVMGGHGTARTDPYYHKVAHAAYELTKRGFFLASGGGPGIMEATNLGAWMAAYTQGDLEHALAILSSSPVYTSDGFQAKAAEVVRLYPEGASSVAIPTWFYGHEPSNQFSSYVAKYFSNGLREDGLLAIASHGVIYAPGSAGTTQEIFMDAAQNHYVTFDAISPMVFLGADRYGEQTGLFATLKRLAAGKEYAEYLSLHDDVSSVVETIMQQPPKVIQS